jgi:tol-pal system protein YbgF
MRITDKILVSLLLIFGIVSSVFAEEIPIEDLSVSSPQLSNDQAASRKQQATQPVVHDQYLTTDQRVIKLEQQMDNFVQMDLAGKMEDLQNQIQQLRGDLEVQKHDLKILHDQLNNFYQDIDRRIGKNGATSAIVTSNVTAASSVSGNEDNGSEVKTSSKSNLDDVPLSPRDVSEEQTFYQDALKLFKDKKYSEGINKMQAYLKDYPNGKYAANAHYWLGEIYYMQSQLQKSFDEFQTVINIYPNSTKVPDAMLKTGMIYNDRGEYDKAYKQFQQIKKKYPDSNAAKLASQQDSSDKSKK